MKTGSASEGQDPRQTGSGSAFEIATVGAILLLAVGVRVFYAYDLPLNGDEISHLAIARTISLCPGTFYFPLGNSVTYHPNGVLYLIAMADWIGRGNSAARY